MPFLPYAGSAVRFRIDLDNSCASFEAYNDGEDQDWSAPIEVDFSDKFKDETGKTMQTGFFCATLTQRASVSLF